MKYKNGELLYVCRRKRHWEDGIFVIYRDEYEGNVDLSYHGSPWYEKFIICEYPDSRNTVEFGDQEWQWRSAKEYIEKLQKALNKIEEIARYR